jgi:uncharacterized protein
MKALFKNIILDFHNQPLPIYKQRNIKIPFDSEKIITLIGSRRVGKTYLFYQLMEEILRTTLKKNILYINFEDERIISDNLKLGDIIDAYYELYPNNTDKIYFFFDEIENIEGWEKFVRRMYDNYSKNIFLTGSSSKLLHKEIATSLRGRSIYYEIFPLSFTEFLEFSGISYDDIDSTINKAKIRNAFQNYFQIGGFPEAIDYNNEIRKKTLQTYLDVMIYRDIIERHELSNITAVRYFIKKAIVNTSNKASINRLFNELKSQGIKVSKESLYNYMDYTQDCYMLYFVNLYDLSVAVQSVNEKKIYCIDNGLINASTFKLSKDYGRLLENLVFIELRRYNYEIYYHSDKYECDFILTLEQEPQQALQVAFEFEEQTKKREIRGLMEALQKYNLKEGIILTMDEEYEFEQENKLIRIIPIWKWMISNSKTIK